MCKNSHFTIRNSNNAAKRVGRQLVFDDGLSVLDDCDYQAALQSS